MPPPRPRDPDSAAEGSAEGEPVANSSDYGVVEPGDFASDASALRDFLCGLGYPIEADPKDLCGWAWILCTASGYELRIQNHHLGGNITREVGKLRYLRGLILSNTSLRGHIPSDLGNLTRLVSLDLSRNHLVGKLPSELGALEHLEYFSVFGNDLSGELEKDFWQGWVYIRNIDLRHNGFSGLIPDLDLSVHRSLSALHAANNRFRGFHNVSDRRPLRLGNVKEIANDTPLLAFSLDLANNAFTELPGKLKGLACLASLSLSHNNISELPPWGYFSGDEDIAANMRDSKRAVGNSIPCFWRYPNKTDLEPPRWPHMRAVDLSSNPISVPVCHLMQLFGNVPLLSLRCADCRLHGSMTFADTRFVRSALAVAPGHEDCTLAYAFPQLERIDLSANPEIVPARGSGIARCDLVEVAVLEDRQDVRCASCPPLSSAPSAFRTPLASQAECMCWLGMTEHYTMEGSKVCACPDGRYFDPFFDFGAPSSQEALACKECAAELDCEWGDNWQRSIEAPALRPGSWMACLEDEDKFSYRDLYYCYSRNTCIGGGVTLKGGCFADSICAEGRTGLACGQCLPGRYGHPGGPCQECMAPPALARWNLCIAAAVFIPVLYFGMRLLANNEAHRMTGLILLRRLRMMFRQTVKYVQIVTVVTAVDVTWPKEIKAILEVFSRLTVSAEVILQSRCMTTEYPSELGLMITWLVPLGLVLLLALACCFASVFRCLLARLLPRSRCAARVVSLLRHDASQALVFTYMLWTMYYASLTSVALRVFVCREHPNSRSTILWYPDVECATPRWWPLAVGGLLSVTVYVLFYLGATYAAVRHVARHLKEDPRDRGPLGFATDGLRVGKIYHHLFTAIKDVLLNLAVAAFTGASTTNQLFICAGILAYYAHTTMKEAPYETWSMNAIEVTSSAGLAVVLLLTAGLGFQTGIATDLETSLKDSSTENIGVVWILMILVASVVVPGVLMVYEVIIVMPALLRRMPRLLRPRSAEELQGEKRWAVAQLEPEELGAVVDAMDSVEWMSFAKSIWGTAALRGVMQGEGDAMAPATTLPQTSWRLRDPELISARFRATAYQRRSSEVQPPTAQPDEESASQHSPRAPRRLSVSSQQSSALVTVLGSASLGSFSCNGSENWAGSGACSAYTVSESWPLGSLGARSFGLDMASMGSLGSAEEMTI